MLLKQAKHKKNREQHKAISFMYIKILQEVFCPNEWELVKESFLKLIPIFSE